jgi:thiol-disulfide isomerase/thioredoxin
VTTRPFHALWLVLLFTPAAAVAGDRLNTPYPSPTNLALERLDGTIYDPEAYTDRPRIINFWTSWCPPCLREMPSLERLSQDLYGDGIDVLAVNVAESAHRVKRVRQLPGGNVIVLLDRKGEHARRWGVQVYPSPYVVDTDGNIVMQITGGVDWDSAALRTSLQSLP